MERQPDRCGTGHRPVTVARVCQQLVEEGFEAVLTPRRSPASARQRIFDGAAEAKLTALACSEPPKERARSTLPLLEDKVVELNIVARVSDNTIGRTPAACRGRPFWSAYGSRKWWKTTAYAPPSMRIAMRSRCARR
jgi:hypothetical protein